MAVKNEGSFNEFHNIPVFLFFPLQDTFSLSAWIASHASKLVEFKAIQDFGGG